jgi:hypothetical protein
MLIIPLMMFVTALILMMPFHERLRVLKLRRSYDNHHLQTFEPIQDVTLRHALRPQGTILC